MIEKKMVDDPAMFDWGIMNRHSQPLFLSTMTDHSSSQQLSRRNVWRPKECHVTVEVAWAASAAA